MSNAGDALKERKLSDHMQAFRADRPSEWLMDEWIRRVKAFEDAMDTRQAPEAALQSDDYCIYCVRLKNCFWRHQGKDKPCTRFHGRTLYDAQPTQEAQATRGWISVKDRLPEDCDEVLIWPRPYKSAVAIFMEVEDTTGFGWDGVEYHPTHWMPLPEAPTAETVHKQKEKH